MWSKFSVPVTRPPILPSTNGGDWGLTPLSCNFICLTIPPAVAKMLRPDLNQVAGHRLEEGNVGSLVDDQGRFYKPLQDKDRGNRELVFYEKFWADETVPKWGKKFFPGYYGSTVVEASNGSGPLNHAILDNLIDGYRKPSVLDVKIGFQTWYPGASEAYISKCRDKDSETSSGTVGFRISGMQVYDAEKGSKWKPDRDWCRKLTGAEVRAVLKRFASTNPYDDTAPPDGALIASVYSGPNGIIAQLEEVIAWFEEQTSYHFYSCSVLLVYEGDQPQSASKESKRRASVKLVDFAHVVDGKGSIDDNFLQGLKSLHHILSSLVKEKATEDSREERNQ